MAEQSNESAEQISNIIDALTQESEKSVEIMEEVQHIVDVQSGDVETAELAFKELMDGIDKSLENITEIAKQTEDLDGARLRITDIVQNLMAIAQENAASTEETSASAVEVGLMTKSINEESVNIVGVADTLKQTIDKFIL